MTSPTRGGPAGPPPGRPRSPASSRCDPSTVRQRGTGEEEEPDLEDERGGYDADHDYPLDAADSCSLARDLLPFATHAAQPRRGAARGMRPVDELVVRGTQTCQDQGQG